MKRAYYSVVAVLLALVMLFAGLAVAPVNAAIVKGDLDDDSYVTTKDVLLFQKYLAKKTSAISMLRADVDDNANVNARDLLKIKKYIVFNDWDDHTSGGGGDKTTVTQTIPGQSTRPAGTGPEGVPLTYPLDQAVCLTINGCSYYTVAVNQVGYSQFGEKRAKLTEGQTGAPTTANSLIQYKDCYLVDTATNKVVFTASSEKRNMFTKKIAGRDAMYVSNLDFSEFTTPGTYRIYTPIGYSYEFEIGSDVYQHTFDNVLMGLYYQRCGDELSLDVIKEYDKVWTQRQGVPEGTYANVYDNYVRPICHYNVPTNNALYKKEVTIVDTYSNTDNKFHLNKDASGNVIQYDAADFAFGLHDAGDYGRYTQPAAQVVGDLLATYEMFPEACTLDVVQDTNGKGQPDTLPDILDHARWEAKFLLNMQNNIEGSSSNGGFYHKICTHTFASANGSKPETDKGFYGTNGAYKGIRTTQVNLACTASCAGALAHCAVVFKNLDPAFAAECLEAAERGWAYYELQMDILSNPDNYTALQYAEAKARQGGASSAGVWCADSVGGGAYGGTASEATDSSWYTMTALYRATGKEAYHTSILKRSASWTSGSIPCNMTSQSHSGFGTFNYVMMAKNGERTYDENLYKLCTQRISGLASNAYGSTNALASRFDNSVGAGSYAWGSNNQMFVQTKPNAIAFALNLNAEQNVTALRRNNSFVLGVNPENWCFVTGETDFFSTKDGRSSKDIHHFPSQLIKGGANNKVIPGLLAGGYTDDGGYLFEYADNSGNYVGNEICVYWNSSQLLNMAAIIQDDLADAKANK